MPLGSEHGRIRVHVPALLTGGESRTSDFCQRLLLVLCGGEVGYCGLSSHVHTPVSITRACGIVCVCERCPPSRAAVSPRTARGSGTRWSPLRPSHSLRQP